jgi:Kef-type K+ transport system membrane component KefB
MHGVTTPLATSAGRTELLLVSVLVQLIIMVGAARLMNILFHRLGQPGVVGEIVAGLMLGPSLLGHFFPGLTTQLFGARPATAIVILSQLGLILLMFQIGMGFEFGRLRQARARKAVLAVSAVSITVPFGCGIVLGYASHGVYASGIPPLIYGLFCGVAMAITAVPILGRILVAYGLAQHELGVMAISAAALNDVAGWILLGIISALATAGFVPAATGLQLAGIALFALISVFILRPLAAAVLRAMPLQDGEISPSLMTIALIFVFALGICTFKLGIFGIFGGFVAGLLVHHDTAFAAAWRRQVGGFVMIFFLPIFFTFTGLHTNVLGLTSVTDWSWTLVFVVISIASKIVPVTAVTALCGYTAWEGLLTGVLMNTRALMELIVLNIGLETGFLPQKVFTMLVIMAVVTTVMTGPLLTLTLARIGLAVSKPVEA